MNKIVIKLGGTIMALFLVVLLPLGYVANQIFTNFYYNQVQEEIEQLSEKYARTAPSIDDKSIIRMFMSLADLTNKEIVILDKNGNVIADSGIRIVNVSTEDLNKLSQGKPVQNRFQDFKTEQSYLGSGYPVMESNIYKGALFVLASVSDVEEPINKIRDLLTLSAAGALFLALGFTFLISKKMSDPLLEMEKATREIAKGNLDIRVKIVSDDEVGSLGNAINDLAFETNRYRTNRKEFFANISHELRTPIAYLQGYSRVLKQGLYKSEEERHQYLNIIEDETERLIRLINDLFDLSKMEEGKVDLQMEMIDLTDLLETVLLKLKIEMDKKQLKLNSKLERDAPNIMADRIRLQQIFTNLLRNGVNYTEKGSINVQLWSEHNRVIVTIEDTGIGIPEEELPLIFERFHRVEKSRSREFGGTGLGLAIVKNLVELQNGTIKVKSQLGRGTKFQLSFPIPSKEEL